MRWVPTAVGIGRCRKLPSYGSALSRYRQPSTQPSTFSLRVRGRKSANRVP